MTDYEYRVKIEAYDHRLIEPEMFVLNNEDVTAYFNQKYTVERCTVRSCEVIAQDAIYYFLSLFESLESKYSFIHVQKIKVWVRGAEESFITGEWVKPSRKKEYSLDCQSGWHEDCNHGDKGCTCPCHKPTHHA